MEDFFSVPNEQLPQTLAAMQREMKKRGWRGGQYLHSGGNILFAVRPDGKEVHCSFGTSPTMSYGAGAISDDKYATYCILKSLLPEVKQPETILLQTPEDAEKECNQLRSLLSKYNKIVLKPLDGAHGNGVITGISDLTSAIEALNKIRKEQNEKNVIAQEMLFIDGTEIRAVVIDYHFVAAYARIPARVTGDGKHNVLELIDIENQTFRTKPYVSHFAYINKVDAETYLSNKDESLKTYIPANGEKVQVIPVSNQGQGGTNEYLSDIPEHLKRQAEKVATALELPLAGVDIFGDSIIEVNKAPALCYPVDGEPATICVRRFLDYLENLPL